MKKKTVFKKTAPKKIGIVAARFNEFITKRLLEGCLDELKRAGVRKERLIVQWVPGSFELPLAALKLAKSRSVGGVICLGAVIRGETYHFELVAQGAAQGIQQVALKTEKPVIFGVITAETVNQAYQRSEEKGDNKGRDSACAVLDMMGEGGI